MKINKFKNITNRDITVFLNNAKPIKFKSNQTIKIPSTDLHMKYPGYITLIQEEVSEKVVKEVVKKKEFISEVKNPTENKELISEPVVEVEKDVIVEVEPKKEIEFAPKPKKKKAKKQHKYTKKTEETIIGSISKD